MENLLRVERLSAGYGDTQVLWDVSLRVPEGEVVALVGSNGAGKSTLLAAVTGLIRVRSGHVWYGERDLAGSDAAEIVACGIAHVPQGRRLFSAMTVRENLLMGAYLRTDNEVDKDLKRVTEIFPRVGERIGFLAGRLSGGEQQMVAIGRALMSRPKLLLIDEMSLGLAPVLVDTLLERLHEINEQGVAILLVEQDVQTALEFAKTAYVLETGHIKLSGLAHQLIDDPAIKKAYLGV